MTFLFLKFIFMIHSKNVLNMFYHVQTQNAFVSTFLTFQTYLK
jgi:hypothetical protein